MSHVVAILGLAAACALWVALQRWSGDGERAPCGEHGADCDGCETRGAECPPAERISWLRADRTD